MIENIVIACFCFVMACNVVVMTRHYLMLRALKRALEAFDQGQREFTAMMGKEFEKRRVSLAPDLE